MDIFGKSAQQLNPLIQAGSGRLKELAEQAHEVGYVIDNETLQSFGSLDDASQQLDKKFDAVKNTLAQALLPVLTAFADLINSIPTEALTFISVLGGIVVVATSVAKAIGGMVSIGTALSGALTAIGITGGIATAGLSGMLPVIALVTGAIIGLTVLVTALTGGFDSLGKAADSVSNATQSAASAATNYPKNARGTPFWTGGRTVVGEEGPEIVDLPRGSRIWPTGTGDIVGGTATTNTFYVTIDAKNIKAFNDVVRIAEQEKTSIRKGVK